MQACNTKTQKSATTISRIIAARKGPFDAERINPLTDIYIYIYGNGNVQPEQEGQCLQEDFTVTLVFFVSW